MVKKWRKYRNAWEPYEIFYLKDYGDKGAGFIFITSPRDYIWKTQISIIRDLDQSPYFLTGRASTLEGAKRAVEEVFDLIDEEV